MHGAAIVPDHEVVDTPAMRVDELPLGRMRYEFIDQRPPLGLWHAEDATGMGREIKRFTAGFRNDTHHRLRHRRHSFSFFIAELGNTQSPAGIEDRGLRGYAA